MTARARLAVLVAAALTLLAFATTAEQRGLTVVPAAESTVAPAAQRCEQRKPHTGDTVTFSMRWDGYALAPHVHAYRCAAAHPGGAPGTGHFYDVLVWDRDDNGVAERVEWVPLGPWWT